jgi:dTDP-4-dehydrorhamnose reductase
MATPVILVTGANGQLGKELQVLADSNSSFSFLFTTKQELPVQDAEQVRSFFSKHRPAFCINCAAYTAVDKAETEKDQAFLVNAEAVGILAAACRQFAARLIHISTDYVFDGQSPVPYTEEAATNPLNVYGASKLRGEQLCMQNNPDVVIIRTAWVYSGFGNNFVKTMLRLMNERKEISVVNDQIGAPTYAADLARCILEIITKTFPATGNGFPWRPGIYHYSNQGRISWYDFAMTIKELTGSSCTVKPVPAIQYPTPARRPSFSLLDTYKIQNTFKCSIPGWKDALQRCLQKLNL